MTTHQAAPVEDTPVTTQRRSTLETLRGHIERRLNVPPWVLLVEVFIGFGWLRAAIEKVMDPAWWNGSALREFIEIQLDSALPWYRVFLETVIEPNVFVVSVIVVFAQFFAGVALISGWKVLAGLATGVFLNMHFIAAGAVNPSIFYLVCQIALLLYLLHGESRISRRQLRLLATASFVLVLVNLPFISTIDPAEVIEDPAMVLVTLGLLTAVASRVGARS